MANTTLLFHTGTTTPTDIGPATGGILYSVMVDSSAGGGVVTIRDGGSSGTILFQGSLAEFQSSQGVALDGQLNIQLGSAEQRVMVEMVVP
jgi:hypothetical protein